MEQIRVIVADDHVVIREGLRALLDAEPDIRVVGEAETGRQAVQLAKKLLPSVVLMDLMMPQLNGIEATRQIVRELPSVRVLALSAHGESEYAVQLRQAGAAGYLLKYSTTADLLRAVRQVHAGNAFVNSAISSQFMREHRGMLVNGNAAVSTASLLTSRESEVLQLIAEGAPNKQIAAELSISIKTVEKHRQQVMNKLNIHNIAGLTRYAIARGFVEQPSRISATLPRDPAKNPLAACLS